jgi:antitoxin component of RelBE/YafQ-DinJ toxin-antitoxin module
MANLSLRMRDELKLKAQRLAQEQGVSLNNYINAVVAASVAQEETLAFFQDRLKDVDLAKLHERVLRFMQATRPGTDPPTERLNEF